MQQMELWFTEKQTPSLGITALVKETLYTQTTPFQEIAVLDTVQFGRMMVLDGMIQVTDSDEFVYHEMISHVAMQTHPNPRRVLVIGGGDGGAVREIMRYPGVEKAVLVEIDKNVIDVSRRFFPAISSGLDDSRLDLRIEDGFKFVQKYKQEFDIILIDSTEPVGAAVSLFSREFYMHIYEALNDSGIMVAQTESPFYNQDLITNSFQRISSLFPHTHLYLANIPTYPSGVWSFTIGSKKTNPRRVAGWRKELSLKYYTPEVHRAAFALPEFVQCLVRENNE